MYWSIRDPIKRAKAKAAYEAAHPLKDELFATEIASRRPHGPEITRDSDSLVYLGQRYQIIGTEHFTRCWICAGIAPLPLDCSVRRNKRNVKIRGPHGTQVEFAINGSDIAVQYPFLALQENALHSQRASRTPPPPDRSANADTQDLDH